MGCNEINSFGHGLRGLEDSPSRLRSQEWRPAMRGTGFLGPAAEDQSVRVSKSSVVWLPKLREPFE
jgi:hypothetical protein